METQHLKNFKVNNFKRFDSFEVDNLGQFNLIVGDNNVGKTTFLEALVMNDQLEETASRLLGCLVWRKLTYTKGDSNFLETYFKDPTNQSIKYSFKINNDIKNFIFSVIETSTLSKEQQNEINLKNIGNTPFPYSISLEDTSDNFKEINFLKPVLTDVKYMPFINYNLSFADDLIEFFSDIVQQNKKNKQEIVDGLEIIIPEIENIEISSSTSLNPTFLISLKNQDRPLFLNHFGDGTIKLFRYLLEIKKCSDSRIMIDEIDTGIHYSKMKNFLKILFQLAAANNVQIFATTHSKECIQYYKEALTEINQTEKARVISLEELPHGKVKAYSYDFDSFSNALDTNLEIRGN